MSDSVICAKCGEENKAGSERCARCGVVLDEVEGSQKDPELVGFDVAQEELEEKNRQEHRDRLLKDISTTGWGLLGRR